MIAPRSNVKLGLVPTHIRFVGGLVPNDAGEMPKNEDGQLKLLDCVQRLVAASPAAIEVVQFPLFDGVRLDEVRQLLTAMQEMQIEPQLILMLGGGNPMLSADEEAFVTSAKQLVGHARDLGVAHLSSTSLEIWMEPGAQRLEGEAYREALQQIAKVHQRVVQETELLQSGVKHWHLEFLREGEFRTFTDLQRGWDAVRHCNELIGAPFFKVLVDAAHCGDSTRSLDDNLALIRRIGEADELGIFHASAKTTRGCLSTDDGWIGATLQACAETGRLEYALVEVFHHEDEALGGLRELDSGHGIDTTDGRTYDQVVVDGLVGVAHRLNNLAQRGQLSLR